MNGDDKLDAKLCRDTDECLDAGVDLAKLQTRDLRLFHAEALTELALRKIVLRAIADDRDGHGTRQHCPLPLGPEFRIGAELLGDQLVVRLHLARIHAADDHINVVAIAYSRPACAYVLSSVADVFGHPSRG